MEGIQFFLLIAQIVIAILMIILVLAQKSDGDSLGGLSSSSTNLNSAISSKAGASVLNKITMSLIALFMVNCLILASITKNNSAKITKDLESAIKEHNSNITNSTSNKSNSTPEENPSSLNPSIPEVE